jgi:hypothetical protein
MFSAFMKFFLTLFILLSFSFCAQKEKKLPALQLSAIGFYNLENLYDTLDDPLINDDDFTPNGLNRWTGERYRLKLQHLAKSISDMATDVNPDGLAILGMCEVENKSVIEDLIKEPLLKKRKYQIVHIEGPDARGVDPSFIYQPKYFKVLDAKAFSVVLGKDTSHKTRDILMVRGLFLGEPTAFLVNHWPSRRGGELKSRHSRNLAAKRARHIADSLSVALPGIKILIMGDLNDDPINESVKKYIHTFADLDQAQSDLYYNPMESLYNKGIGSLAFQDAWNLFDQIMLNAPCLPTDYSTWQYVDVRIHNKAYLRSDHGNFKGYPFRTYSGSIHTGGYSDHFASYILVGRRKK